MHGRQDGDSKGRYAESDSYTLHDNVDRMQIDSAQWRESLVPDNVIGILDWEFEDSLYTSAHAGHVHGLEMKGRNDETLEQRLSG